MAWGTWFATNTLLDGVHQEMSETSPGADATSSPVTGWVVGNTAATVRSSFDSQTQRAWATNAGQPDGTPDVTLGDCLRTPLTYSGPVGAATWTFNFRAIGNVASGAGRIYFWLLRGTLQDGSNAVNITTAAQAGGIVSLSTAQFTSGLTTASITGFTLNNEYIFCQLAWEITTTGGMTTNQVNMRVGATATTLTTAATFTPAPKSLIVPTPSEAQRVLRRR